MPICPHCKKGIIVLNKIINPEDLPEKMDWDAIKESLKRKAKEHGN